MEPLPRSRVSWRELLPSAGDPAPDWDTLDRWRHELSRPGMAIAAVCGAQADLVLAGALLHDVGKLEAYAWSGTFAMTDEGALLGHVALGMLMLGRTVARTTPAPCTARELTLLQHLDRLTPRHVGVRRRRASDDSRGRGSSLRGQRQRQDDKHGRSPRRSRPLHGLQPVERAIALAAGS